MGTPERSRTIDENLRAIERWEQEQRENRSVAERFSDWITRGAATGTVMSAHVIWFAGWIVINRGWLPGIEPFDRFPFPLLTTIVSLEAIFLTLFVLASQNQLSQQADERERLDLQIDLLAEREMTTVLVLLQDLARHLDVQTSVSAEQVRDLGTRTDIYQMVGRLKKPDSSKHG